MDSGLEERRLPSIRRSQIVSIYRNSGVDNLETLWSGPLRGRETSQEREAVQGRHRGLPLRLSLPSIPQE